MTSFMPCINMRSDGTLCQNRANKSGYCRDCDPAPKKELVVVRKNEAKKEMEKRAKAEQREEVFNQQMRNMIAECQSLEDLRKLELKIMQGLIDGTIQDPRIGSPVVQILKHQETLIAKMKQEGDELKPHERDRAIEMSKEMTTEQMLGLIGDLAHGMKKLAKEARERTDAIDVEATEVPDDD